MKVEVSGTVRGAEGTLAIRFCPWKGGRARWRVHNMSCGISAPSFPGLIKVGRIQAEPASPTHPQAPLPNPQDPRPTIACGPQHVELLCSALGGRLWRPQLAAVN